MSEANREQVQPIASEGLRQELRETSVKQVISELQAAFGGLGPRREEEDHKGSQPEKSDSGEKSGEQLEGDILPTRKSANFLAKKKNKKRQEEEEAKQVMESDYSLDRDLKTVSVSTCPSCGSENVASCASGAGFNRRASSFQHLPDTKHLCDKCVTGPVGHIGPHRAHSFSFAHPHPYQPDPVLPMFDCCCSRSAGCCGRCKKKTPYLRVKREPLKRMKKRYANVVNTLTRKERKKAAMYQTDLYERNFKHVMNDMPCPGCKSSSYSSYKGGPPSYDHLRKGSKSHSPNARDNYRFWDVEEWRAQTKREQAKEREKTILMVVAAIGIIVFIAVSYFGTLLFLRVTKIP